MPGPGTLIDVSAEELDAILQRLQLAKNPRLTTVSPLSDRSALRSVRIKSTSVTDLSPLAGRIRAGWPVRSEDYPTGATVSVSQSNREDLSSLWAFKDKLTGLGHYWTPYESAEHLKRHFRDQLDSLLDGQAK